MTEMGPVARFFVNLRATRNSRRRYEWMSQHWRLPAHPRCLEIGCGNGEFAAAAISGLDPEQFVATDLDPRQIELARRHLARRYVQGLPSSLILRTADMLSLPFPDASFHATFAFNVLHHTGEDRHDPTNLPKALAELHRVLRPGGNLAYAEFLHTDQIRRWLLDRGYVILAEQGRRRGELVVSAKPAPSVASDPPRT